MRLVPPQRLDPCIGFAFMLQDHSEYWAFCDELRFMINEDQENAIFGLYESGQDLLMRHDLGRLGAV